MIGKHLVDGATTDASGDGVGDVVVGQGTQSEAQRPGRARRAEIETAGESSPVQAGSVVFVPAGVAHYFHSIAEELSVLVVFAPAEYSRANP